MKKHRFLLRVFLTAVMLVTALYRQAWNPAVESAASFCDVPAGAYYADAVS